MSQFVSFLPPPGAALANYDSKQLHTSQPDDVPEIFCDAMSVRTEVFVEEQKVPMENELDEDDARSYHWVAYASVGTSGAEQAAAADKIRQKGSSQSGRRGSTAQNLAIGTIRLVPPPHPPHPEPSSHHAIDNHEGTSPDADAGLKSTETHDGKEPYVKLGRLAVLPAFRGNPHRTQTHCHVTDPW